MVMRKLHHNILQEITPFRDRKDDWVWLKDSSKYFTVKSFYVWLSSVVGDDNGLSNDTSNLLLKIWNSASPSKIAIFGWRLFRNSLPTRENLHQRNVIVVESETMCAFCRLYCEDTKHVFLDCCFAKEIWDKVYLWLGIVSNVNVNLIEHFYWLGKECKGRKGKRT